MSETQGDSQKPTPFDGLLKHLADQFAPDLLAYLVDLKGIKSCEPVGGEVEMIHRLTDRVWRVTQSLGKQTVEYLFHLEFESSSVPHMERRLGMYGWGLYAKEGLPVRHLVWYVGDRRPADWPDDAWRVDCEAEMAIGDDVISTLSWQEVWLPGGHDASHFLAEAPPYLLPFAVLMKGMKKPLLSRLKSLIMDSGLPSEQQQDLLAMVVFFACRKFELKDVLEAVQMEIFENNPMTDYLIQEGIKRGLQRGREEGRQESLIHLLQVQTKKRFPGVGEGTLSLLEELSPESLQLLGEELLDIPDGRAFRKRVLSLKA